MPLVPKIDPNKIFASNAPSQDKPSAFDNYEKGMDETRKNLGRPTIKQLNYLHQTADQKILWIHQNGGGLPYDPSIEYAEKSVTLKDGELKQLVGGAWVEVKTKSLPATAITTASTQNQQEINDFGGAKWYAKSGGYGVGATVKLENGNAVQSTVAANTVNPNVDMAGWVKANDASQIFYGLQNQAEINSRTATPYDHGAIGDGVAHPLSERFPTLLAAQAVYPSATALTEYIDSHALNAWWRDICANDRNYATAHGKFVCNTKISNVGINSIANIIKTRRVDFNADLKFVGLSGNGFEIISPRQTEFTGFINAWDVGLTVYANRTIDNLIYMEDFIHGVFKWKVVAKYAKNLGLMVFSGVGSLSGGYANNNTSDLGDWQFGSCGHRFKHGSFNFSSRSDSGSSSVANQRTLLTLSAPHGLGDLTDSMIRFKDKPYLITASTENSITVYPWLSETDTTGVVEISKGGDFRLDGADSNQIKISSGSADCAICAGDEGFYVGAKLQRTNEGNDVGLRLGNGVDAIQMGGTYLGTYFEINEFDIVKTNVNPDNALIINPIALNLSKCHVLAPIDATSRKPSPTLQSAFNITYGDKTLRSKRLQIYTGGTPNTTLTLKLGEEPIKIRGNTPVITLADDSNIRRLFGVVDVEFEVFGTAANNGTSGVTTIKCEAGYTINSVAADTIIPASTSAFKVSARLVNETDWRVFIYHATSVALLRKGTTAQRPTAAATDGFVYLDTTLIATNGKPIFKSGVAWVDALGAVV